MKPGDIFQERFEIEAVLGKGGFATVYLATQRELERKVAIKVLHLHKRGPRERFKLEARVVARLNHPNIVALHEFGTADDRPFMVLEYVDGETVAERVSKGKAGAAFVLNFLKQGFDGLRAAHREGILHRDLKPTNIMLTGQGGEERVKVLDFGIAKVLRGSSTISSTGTITVNDTVVGTPRYMAPEYLGGDVATPAIDVYSLGLVGLELLTGEVAFSGYKEMELMDRVLKGSVVVPRIDSLPGLSDVLNKMVSPDPDARFATADEAYDALTALESAAEPDHRAENFEQTEPTVQVRPRRGADTEEMRPAVPSPQSDDAGYASQVPTQIGHTLQNGTRPGDPAPADLEPGDSVEEPDFDPGVEFDPDAPSSPPPPEPQSPLLARAEPALEVDDHRPTPERRRETRAPIELDEPERKPFREPARGGSGFQLPDWAHQRSYQFLLFAVFLGVAYATGIIGVETTAEPGHPLSCGFGERSVVMKRQVALFGYPLVPISSNIRCVTLVSDE